MQQNIDLSETTVKRLPFFICKCFEPTLAHLSLAVKGCPDRQAGSEEEDFCHLCETSKEECLLNLQETLSERERKTEKKLPMGLRRHLYWFLSLSFFSISLFVSVCVSPFDGSVFPVQVVFRFSPK